MKIKNTKIYRRLSAFILAGTVSFSMTGCASQKENNNLDLTELDLIELITVSTMPGYDNLNNQVTFLKNKGMDAKLNFSLLSEIDNNTLLDYNDNIISYIKSDDKNNIYLYNVDTCETTQKAVNFMHVYDDAVTYTTNEENKNNEQVNVFNLVETSTGKTQIKILENENYWFELSDKSILYVKQDGNQERFLNNYKLEYGSLEDDFCIISNLITFGPYTKHFKYPTYFNRKKDVKLSLRDFKTMTKYSEDEGYFEYKGYETEYFVDLSTFKRYYSPNKILTTNDGAIINLQGIYGESNSTQIFKNKNGETISFNKYIIDKPIVKYFEETETAIASNLVNDEKTDFYNCELIDLNDINNPSIILSNCRIQTTPIKDILEIYWYNDKKWSLIDLKGKPLVGKYDLIYFMNDEENTNSEQSLNIVCLVNSEDNGNRNYTDIILDKNKITLSETTFDSNESYWLSFTPINDVFKIYWQNDDKYSLIDLEGNQLVGKYDLIYLIDDSKYTNSEQSFYEVTLVSKNDDNNWNHDNLIFDEEGNIIDEATLENKEKNYSKKLTLYQN